MGTHFLPQEDVKSLHRLQSQVKGKRAGARAKAFAESQAQEAKPGAVRYHSAIGRRPDPDLGPCSRVQEKQEPEQAPDAMMDLDKFDLNPQRLKENIVAFPPDFEPIPGKPILFDLALTSFEFPDLSERKKAKAKGGFFSFWRS